MYMVDPVTLVVTFHPWVCINGPCVYIHMYMVGPVTQVDTFIFIHGCTLMDMYMVGLVSLVDFLLSIDVH